MDFTPDIALGLFISGSLLTLATMLIVAGRRRSESLILAFFLVLVALNFGAIAAAHLWTSAAWGRVAYIALAMDPLFLLLFVTSFPYERRSKGVWAFLALVSLSTLGLVIALLARPDLTPFAVRGPYMGVPPLYRAVAAQLHVAYLAAWIFSLKALKDAPTSRLQQRASWALVAVGIAVIPRFGPLLEEVGIYAAGVPPLWKVVLGEPTSVGSSLGATAIDHSFKGLLCASFLAGGWLHVRKLQAVRRPIAIVAAALMIVVLSQFLVTATYAIGIFGGTGVGTFGLRWPIFAVALAYGLLRDEVVEFSRWADIVFAVAGAIIAGLGAALATAVTLGRAQAPPYAIATLALAVGLAFLAPAAWASRLAVRPFLRRSEDPRVERRLELYRAALETEWARREPDADARVRLERDRRAFGVGIEEARTLEHVVATELRRRRSRVVVGEEPIAGIVIERLLGEGAHGRVFLARRQPGNERVVVKEIIVDVDHVNATRRRFLAESRALARVVHLNVVRLIDAHVTEGKYLLLMEHVAGRSLTEELAAGAMDEARTRSILRDVLDGLAAAHLQGVLHRDVKPSNVLIRENGSAVLTDFSIAATGPLAADIRSTVSNLDALGTLTGTLAYLAPECARGVPASEASDLYAVGLVAYEALAGRPAIDLRGLTLGAALARAERPSIELAAVPDGWREFFARALHVDPARRYANAAEMRNSLEDGSNR